MTDSPYNIGKRYSTKFWNDNQSPRKYWMWYKRVFKEIYRVMKNGYLYVSSLSTQDLKVRSILESLGFIWVQNLIWYHPNMARGSHYISKQWLPLYEPIGMFLKGKRLPMLHPKRYHVKTHDVITAASPQTNYIKDKRIYVVQKAVVLYKTLILRTPGDIILDPFIGSGTTADVCISVNRKFVGIDLDIAVAAERIKKAYEIKKQMEMKL